jgi:hypothetical protein
MEEKKKTVKVGISMPIEIREIARKNCISLSKLTQRAILEEVKSH